MVGKNRGAVIVKCAYTLEEFSEQLGPTKITVIKIVGFILYWSSVNKRVQ